MSDRGPYLGAEETAELVTCLMGKNEDFNLIPRIRVKKRGVLVCAFNSSTSEAETERSLVFKASLLRQ